MYDSDYDSDGSYSYRERRFKWLWYAATFGAGVLVGALVFGRGCPGGPEEEPEAETVAVAETAAEIPEPPPPEPEPAETASPAAEEAIVFEAPPEPPPTFTPARPPEPERTPTKTREVAPRPTGKGLDASEINRVITQRRSGIQSEYNSLLKSNPHLGGGKIVVRFTIAADGRVTSAEVLSDTVGNAEFSSAIVRRVRSWKFPRAGGESTVIYPFVFVSSGV